MEIATLVLAIVAALAQAFSTAMSKGDWSVFDKPVRELLPRPLKTTLAKSRAKAEAEAKFGPKK
jgi:hypothetical protein